MNHEPDTVQYSIRPEWEARYHAELGPPGTVDEHTTEPTAITPAPVPQPPWAPEIIMAVVRLASRVALCERTGELHRLNQFIDAMVEGRSNPLGNLRQYQDIQYDVNDATALIRPRAGAA